MKDEAATAPEPAASTRVDFRPVKKHCSCLSSFDGEGDGACAVHAPEPAVLSDEPTDEAFRPSIMRVLDESFPTVSLADKQYAADRLFDLIPVEAGRKHQRGER